MSIELAFALFVALLYGPTAVWLAYRTIRGRRARQLVRSDFASQATSGAPPVPDVLESLIGPDGFWVCGACHSLNRRESGRCYSCRTPKDSERAVEPGGSSAAGWVPVMADGIVRSSREAGVPVGVLAGVLATPRVAPVAPDAGVAQAAAASAGLREIKTAPAALEEATTSLGAARETAGAPEDRPGAGAAPEARPEASAAPAAVPEVGTAVHSACPYLGTANDPATRFDFPDPANRCHAASTKRSSPVDAELQRSTCLTATHATCARYRAIESSMATRR